MHTDKQARGILVTLMTVRHCPFPTLTAVAEKVDVRKAGLRG